MREGCPKRNGLGHHWILDADSYGVCKLCGTQKQYARPSELPPPLASRFSLVPQSPYAQDGEIYRAMELAGMETKWE